MRQKRRGGRMGVFNGMSRSDRLREGALADAHSGRLVERMGESYWREGELESLGIIMLEVLFSPEFPRWRRMETFAFCHLGVGK